MGELSGQREIRFPIEDFACARLDYILRNPVDRLLTIHGPVGVGMLQLVARPTFYASAG